MISVFRFARLALYVILLCTPAILVAQGGQIAFGNTRQDSNLPVEVTADNLAVNQNDNTALFTGNVLIGQGDMRLSAPRVLVVYLADQSGIEMLKATGGVTLVSGEDAAESERADYNIETGLIEMHGDVLLVQGLNVLTADTMFVDTVSGTARMAGRVKTVLNTKN